MSVIRNIHFPQLIKERNLESSSELFDVEKYNDVNSSKVASNQNEQLSTDCQ